jgi:hypothetical protein
VVLVETHLLFLVAVKQAVLVLVAQAVVAQVS